MCTVDVPIHAPHCISVHLSTGSNFKLCDNKAQDWSMIQPEVATQNKDVSEHLGVTAQQCPLKPAMEGGQRTRTESIQIARFLKYVFLSTHSTTNS